MAIVALYNAYINILYVCVLIFFWICAVRHMRISARMDGWYFYYRSYIGWNHLRRAVVVVVVDVNVVVEGPTAVAAATHTHTHNNTLAMSNVTIAELWQLWH